MRKTDLRIRTKASAQMYTMNRTECGLRIAFTRAANGVRVSSGGNLSDIRHSFVHWIVQSGVRVCSLYIAEIDSNCATLAMRMALERGCGCAFVCLCVLDGFFVPMAMRINWIGRRYAYANETKQPASAHNS